MGRREDEATMRGRRMGQRARLPARSPRGGNGWGLGQGEEEKATGGWGGETAYDLFICISRLHFNIVAVNDLCFYNGF